MGKAKISDRRKKSSVTTQQREKTSELKLRKDTGIRECNPTKEILNEALISRAIWECLKEGDSEGVVEVIQIYLEAVNKTQIAKESEMSRSTMYYTLKSKNPTIKTLAKLIHACV